ncbi:MAG: hypothetical protein V4465_02445 [Patescibacteria group bacterium]
MNTALKTLLGIIVLVLLIIVWKSPLVRDSLSNITSGLNSTSTSSDKNLVVEPNKNGRISGHVTLSPTCPVERVPADPACAPKAYPTTVLIKHSQGAKVAQVKTDAQGEYNVWVSGGLDYDVTPLVEGVYPKCETKTVHVDTDENAVANILCDSGIR